VTHRDAAPNTDRPVSLSGQPDLDALVADHDVVLVEFYTEGCPTCGSMEPVLANVARAGETVVGTVNPRDDPELIERFAVRSVPLFVLFVGGDPVDRRADGFVGADDLVSWIAAHAD
jgi:thioredoxin-like negative regulator of GroEL